MKKQTKGIVSLLLALIMIFSVLPLNIISFAEGPNQTVTVKVAPKASVTATFYEATDTTHSNPLSVTDNGTVGNYHQYTLNVPAGQYICIGNDSSDSKYLGGDAFTVTTESAQSFVFVRTNIRYNGASLNQEGDYTFTLKNAEDKEVIYGIPYVTNNIRYTPTFLLSNVNYQGKVTLNEKFNDDYYLNPSTGAFSKKNAVTAYTAQTVNLPITQYKMIKVTAPTDAATSFYQQTKNFVVTSLTPDSSVANADGTTTYMFKSNAAHSNYQFRVSKPGEVTQAGYIKDGNDIKVTFPSDKGVTTTNSAMAYDDNSVMLNINSKNKLSLNVGDTFKLRAFRAAWQIINTTSGNQMIEPDFHYSILSGNDVVTISPDTGASSGNASGNWLNIKALKAGTAIVAIYYDAIDVYGANPPSAESFSRFGATKSDRYGIFVVNVGNDASVTLNSVTSDGDLDAEFDTFYYAGDNYNLVLKPSESIKSIKVTNVVGTSVGSTKNATLKDGAYSVPLTTGNNIIAIETANGIDYQVVRARKISYTIKNETTGVEKTNAAPEISTGDKVTISFDKLDMPVPKFSGIYNPGYLGTAKTAYMLNDEFLLTSKGTQYDFSTVNSISFTANTPGTNSLEGYISLSSMGSDFGAHRDITDAGVPANMNASEKFGSFGVLPSIKFDVKDTGIKPSYEDSTKVTSISVVGGLNTYTNGFNWNKVESNNAAWTKATSAMTNYSLIAKVVTQSYNNKIELKYWYDGEKVNTLKLQSGVSKEIKDFNFDADKILNLKVVVTPVGTEDTKPVEYSYVVYPGTTNQKYVHPIIKSLSFSEGTLDKEINYADLDYTLTVDCDATVNIDGEQVIKIYNSSTAADMSDAVTLTKYKDGKAVGSPITILEKGLPNNPNRYWTANDIDLSDSDELKFNVKSYVEGSNAERTYTIKLDKQHDFDGDGVCSKCGLVLQETPYDENNNQKTTNDIVIPVKLKDTLTKVKSEVETIANTLDVNDIFGSVTILGISLIGLGIVLRGKKETDE